MLCSILNWLMISWYCQYTLCIGVGFNCNQMFYPIFENSMIKHNLNGPLVLLIVDVQTSFFFLPRCQIFCHCYIFQIYKTKISLTKYQNAILILYCISFWDMTHLHTRRWQNRKWTPNFILTYCYTQSNIWKL